MSNPLSNLPPQLISGVQQIKGLMQQLGALSNPNLAIQKMAQSNPQMQQVLSLCNGRNPKDVFYSMCQQRGINPEQILSMLK